VSYGTYLVQQYARRYPASTGAVVLDAVVPADTNFVPAVYLSFNQSLNAIVAACKADDACRRLTDLERDLFVLIDRLDRQPVRLDLELPDGRDIPYLLDGDRLLGLLRSSVYAEAGVARLPLLVASGLRGDFSLAEDLATQQAAGAGQVATGMYLSVVCADLGNFNAADAVRGDLRTRLAPIAEEQTAALVSGCQVWRVPSQLPGSLQPFRIGSPVLVLSGGFDPITPPAYGDRAAAMHGGRHVVFPFGSHGQVASACGQRLIDLFLDDPALPLDTACVPREFRFTVN
jgi:pimeloyl-ACP methyl ester carboxylesterase